MIVEPTPSRSNFSAQAAASATRPIVLSAMTHSTGVIRTGLTTAYIIQNLEMKKPKDITLCSMLLNPDRLLMTIPVKYYGFEINDQWLAGYGLDRNEIGRNLPYIAQIPKQK